MSTRARGDGSKATRETTAPCGAVPRPQKAAEYGAEHENAEPGGRARDATLCLGALRKVEGALAGRRAGSRPRVSPR